MPIIVTCPDCGNKNKFSDQKAGRSGRCKHCDRKLAIRKKSTGNNTGLILGVVGGIAGCVLIAAVVFFITSQADQAPVEIAADNRQAEAVEGTDGQTGRIGDPPPAAASPTVAQSPQGDAADASPPDSNNADAMKPAPASKSAFQKIDPDLATLNFVREDAWNVQADPSDMKFGPEPARKVQLELGSTSSYVRTPAVVFPVAPSPFVAVQVGRRPVGDYDIHDVIKGRKISSVSAGAANGLAALAADGSYFAFLQAGKKGIVVIDVKQRQALGTLPISDATAANFIVSHLAIWNDRLVALSHVQHGIKVWELPSGNLLHDIDAGDRMNPNDGCCFSPNGKYCAVVGEFIKHQIDIYDLDSGRIAGSITSQGKPKVNDLSAVGFSADGTQLATIYKINDFSNRRNYSRVVIWDVASGKIDSDFEIEPEITDQLKPQAYSHEMQSLPGGTRWLVHSSGIIDTDAEQLVYQFEKQDRVNLIPSRQVMGDNWLLSVANSQGAQRVEAVSLNEQELLAAINATAAGGFVSDAKLPPLTATDYADAKLSLEADRWQAQPDPLSPAPIEAEFPISTAGTVRDLAVSRGEQPVLGIQAGIDETLDDTPTRLAMQKQIEANTSGLEVEKLQPLAAETQFTAYDAAGQKIAQFNIPFSAQLKAISPDGQLAVFEEHRTNGRLDVYKVDNKGTHVAGFRPFRSEVEEKHREIRQVDFIDAQTLVTLSQSDRLVVWQFPELSPIWTLDQAARFAVSPGGNSLAVLRGTGTQTTGLSLFDAHIGDGQGTLRLSGSIGEMAFHPNGEWLAVSFNNINNTSINIFEIATGKQLDQIATPTPVTSVAWTDKNYLLVNGRQLVDRELQAVVWSYEIDDALLPEAQVSEQTVLLRRRGNQIFAHALSVPQPTVASQITGTAIENNALLKPGDSVRLDVQIAGDRLLEAVRQAARAGVTERLEIAGTKLNDTAETTLTVSASPVTTDGTTTLTRMGVKVQEETVTVKKCLLSFEYSQNGQPIWRLAYDRSNVDGMFFRIKPGQSMQQAVDDQFSSSLESSVKMIRLPRYIFTDEARYGLGTSTFWP